MKSILFKVSLSNKMRSGSNRECIANAMKIFQQSYDVIPVPTTMRNVELKEGVGPGAKEIMECLKRFCAPGALITKYEQRTGLYPGRVFYSFFVPSRRRDVYFVSGEIFNEVYQ